MPSDALIILSKYPEPGKVKTRLTPALSPESAAGVHRIFLRHLLARLHAWDAGDVYVCFDPPERRSDFVDLLGIAADRVFPQSPGDLGARLAAAGRYLAGRYDRIVFFGIDSPDLPPPAFGDADVILGPTADGGYYFVAVRASLDLDRLFERIDWSSGRECDQTVERAGSLGYTVALATPWDDVDHPADLRRLIERLSRSPDPTDRRLLAELSIVREIPT